MAVFHLTLVRHAETNANRERITQGQTDTELSDKGVKQAQLLGQRLQMEGFTHVYSSDLKRCVHTCEAVVRASACQQCDIVMDVRLRERKFGVMEGQHVSVFVEAKNKAYEVGGARGEFLPDGAESEQQVRARAKAFFQELCHHLQTLADNSSNGNNITTTATAAAAPLSLGKQCRNTGSASSDVFPASPTTTCVVGAVNRDMTTGDGVSTIMDVSADVSVDHSRAVDFQNNTTPNTSSGTGGISASSPLLSTSAQCVFTATTQPPQDVEMCCEQNLSPAAANTAPANRSTFSTGSVSSTTSGYASITSGSSLEHADDSHDVHAAALSPDSTQQSKQIRFSIGGDQQQLTLTSRDADGFKKPLPVQCTTTTTTTAAAPLTYAQIQAAFAPPPPTCSFQHQQTTIPNVSLSPITEHHGAPPPRYPSVSSISSDARSDSFDDDYGTGVTSSSLSTSQRPLLANVLVVSHGGLINQLVCYFIDELNCHIPMYVSTAPRASPNASVSRFIVTLCGENRQPAVVCLALHDDEHLRALPS